MAIYEYTDRQAQKNFGAIKGVRWYKAGATLTDKKPKSWVAKLADSLLRFDAKKNVVIDENTNDFACDKIRYDRVFRPTIAPSFKISKDWNVYAIGSCFARGVEKALVRDGFNVLSAAKEFDKFETANTSVEPLGFTNKYTTYSILNEIKWALIPGVSCPQESVVDLNDEISIDPHINPTLKFCDRAETLKRREIISTIQRKIKDCQLVVLTLGLVECWKDNVCDVYLNMTPTKDMMDMFPGRYSLHVIGYEENKANLDQIYRILMEYGHPDLHILLTVSPVPLLATFTGRDVVIANTFSKSVLRTVAEEWAADKVNVNYFPSYEIVCNSQRDVAWQDDLRHVKAEAVNSIMDQLKRCYVE
jgi:hypothetical protein